MTDTFSQFKTGLESPATNMFDVSPDDLNDLPFVSRALNVAVSGAVQVTTSKGDTGTIYVAAGIAFPIRARRVYATGTTASNITALY